MGGKNKKKRKSTRVDSSPPTLSSSSSLSLASQLKRQRGTADTTPLPPEYTKSSSAFLTPSDSDFNDCLATSYRGFSWQEPEELEPALHADFEACFTNLEELYLYDAVQAGGKKVTHTFVKRTLIGEPGSTYRYLGLRLFSHPWSATSAAATTIDEQEAELIKYGYSKPHAHTLVQMGRLNQTLVEKTRQELDKLPQDRLLGSCDYTLTLVNRMEPSSIKKDLKRDPI